MIGIDAHWTVKVETTVVAGHERAVDGNLVEVDPDTMVLSVAIEEHTELEQRVWRVFDARDHASRGESGLFNIPMIVFGIFVQNEATKFMHLELLAGRSKHHSLLWLTGLRTGY